MIGSDKNVSTLNSLIATTIDSINGYRESAKEVENPRFRELFEQLAQDREQALTQLRAEVARLGGEPEDDGTMAAAAHRGWVDLKSAITGRNDKAIVNEVERGEDHIKHKFESALEDDDLSAECRSVVQRAYESVRRGHDRARDLKHSLEAAG
ncbi:MAG TPA: PA2169 family four-helix-bundle protein [Sphingomonas sp.]|nr:PA2169 family four-helix-bundle protein [Sphingomonas sp.]